MKDDKNYIKRIIGFIVFSLIGVLILNAHVMPALSKAQTRAQTSKTPLL